MGNIQSLHGERLATAAVANYVKLTKKQVIQIRNSVEPMVSQNGHIKRRFFHAAMAKAKLAMDPDGDLLDALFTMWDLTGTDSAPAVDFCVGFSVLACYGDDLAAVLKFAMETQDLHSAGNITADQLVNLLKSVAMTSSYFGDNVLGLKHIYKVVDSVFGTMTMISESSEKISHDECVVLLLEEPLVRRMINSSPSLARHQSNTSRVTFSSETDGQKHFNTTRLEDESQMSTDVSSIALTPISRFMRGADGYTAKAPTDRSTLASSSNSTLGLTPLARLPITSQ